jgi:hypothetical protein
MPLPQSDRPPVVSEAASLVPGSSPLLPGFVDAVAVEVDVPPSSTAPVVGISRAVDAPLVIVPA